MKRIIDGVTYNTDTSARLASSDYETFYNHENRPCEGTLYQTRGGAFFIWETIELGLDRSGAVITRDRFKALSAKEAEDWIMTGNVEIVHNPFGEPPEAEAESAPAATLYVRVPSIVKRQVEQAAKEAKLSVNSFMLRCAENCLNDRAPEPLHKIWEISATFRAHSDHGQWTRETLIRALSEIADETEELAKEMFPDKGDDIVKTLPPGDEPYVKDIRERYNSYPG